MLNNFLLYTHFNWLTPSEIYKLFTKSIDLLISYIKFKAGELDEKFKFE